MVPDPPAATQRVPDRRSADERASLVQARATRPGVGHRVVGRGRLDRARSALAAEAPELAARGGAAGGVRRARHGGLRRPRVRGDAVVPDQVDHVAERIAAAGQIEVTADDAERGAPDGVRNRRARSERVRRRVVLPRRRPRARRVDSVGPADEIDLAVRGVVAGRHEGARARHVRRRPPGARRQVEDPGRVAERAGVRIEAAEHVDPVRGRVIDRRGHCHRVGHRRPGLPALVDRVVAVEGVQGRARAGRVPAQGVREHAVRGGRRAVDVLRHGGDHGPARRRDTGGGPTRAGSSARRRARTARRQASPPTGSSPSCPSLPQSVFLPALRPSGFYPQWPRNASLGRAALTAARPN